MKKRKIFQRVEKENVALREQLRFYREYDLLTGLYNKSTFYQKVADHLENFPEKSFDIVCIDIERFKLVNDLYGPSVGDDILRYLADELRKTFQAQGGILSRTGNDIFAMCVPGGEQDAIEQEILRIFRGYPLNMTLMPAIGFCPVSDRKQWVSSMCDEAMLALKSIKGNYLKHAAVYDSVLRKHLMEEYELLNGVEAALGNHEFIVYMQPKCNMYSGKIVGAEALVRWKHSQRGMLPPNEFIPLFERNGFIKRLDAYIWEETAKWLRTWIDAGHKPVPVSINISRIDIFGMDVCKVLEEILAKYRLDAWLLELEITESAYVNQPEEILHTMERLMGSGFTVLMDDFGSGYSSLNMLTDINVNILKIDMRFLERNNQKSRNILESVVHMGKWLNLPVIAEGVETQNQVDFLLGVGCIYAQGFFFYRPMPLREFEALLLDEDKVDYTDRVKLRLCENSLLDFHDLFHKDMMSDRLMGNILGAIALYHFDGKRLSLLRGTEEYYRLVGRLSQIGIENDQSLFATIEEEDRAILLNGLRQAKASLNESGSEMIIRQKRPERCKWIQIRLFHLVEKGEGDIYYGALFDVTDQMESMEKLRISEEQFSLAMEATNIVLFELDVKTHEAWYSEHVQRRFNLDAVVANAPEGFIEQGTVCEESQADFRAVYDAIYKGEACATALIRAKMGDGSIRWNRITLTAVKDRFGETVKAVGLVETVSYNAEPTAEILLELERQLKCRELGACQLCQ